MQKKLLLIITTITLILALLGCANADIQLQSQPESPVTAAPLEVSRISVEESKAAFDNGEAVFLDVRSESVYETTHIPGAVSIPLMVLKPRIAEIDPDQWIITYCT